MIISEILQTCILNGLRGIYYRGFFNDNEGLRLPSWEGNYEKDVALQNSEVAEQLYAQMMGWA